ncbi:MAG TPA: hypothetical protein VJX16_01685 [Terriglobales bacterium]|nr:hypothetical protein [Terriglobales bacterium]
MHPRHPLAVHLSLKRVFLCRSVRFSTAEPGSADSRGEPFWLQKATISAAQVRQHNQEQVNQFFASPLAQRALQDAHIESAQVKKAISTLSDEELAKTAARTQKAQKDVAAGDLGGGRSR